jgi:hypothetical protein
MVHGNGFGNGVDQKLDGVTTFAPDWCVVWCHHLPYTHVHNLYCKTKTE